MFERRNPSSSGMDGLIKGADGHWLVGFMVFLGVSGNLFPELMAFRQALQLA